MFFKNSRWLSQTKLEWVVHSGVDDHFSHVVRSILWLEFVTMFSCKKSNKIWWQQIPIYVSVVLLNEGIFFWSWELFACECIKTCILKQLGTATSRLTPSCIDPCCLVLQPSWKVDTRRAQGGGARRRRQLLPKPRLAARPRQDVIQIRHCRGFRWSFAISISWFAFPEPGPQRQTVCFLGLGLVFLRSSSWCSYTRTSVIIVLFPFR